MPRFRSLAATAFAALVVACVNPRTPQPAPFASPDTIRVRTEGRIRTMPIEEYVLGSALSENTPVGASPAAVARIFDVQTVLARTYAVSHLGRHKAQGFDVCDGTHCQLYQPRRLQTSRFADAARRAVERTQGLVLTFGRQPADALYHSDCGGHTASAGDVWGNREVPYLTGTADDVPHAVHRTWRFDATAEAVRAALNRDPRSAVGRRLERLAIATRDASGRAALLEVRGDRIRRLRGEDFRSILNRSFGERAIMSTRFSVAREGRMYRFTGTGFGHGVGLCQTGAAARAANGAAMRDILAAYFPGTAVSRAARGNLAAAGAAPRPRLLQSP